MTQGYNPSFDPSHEERLQQGHQQPRRRDAQQSPYTQCENEESGYRQLPSNDHMLQEMNELQYSSQEYRPQREQYRQQQVTEEERAFRDNHQQQQTGCTQTMEQPSYRPQTQQFRNYEQPIQQRDIFPERQVSQTQPQGIVVNVVNTNTNTNTNGGMIVGGSESYFDGKLSQQIGYFILGFFVTLLTLGICYPWALCMQYRWKTKHTIINGHRLTFDGKAVQLLGKWLVWLLLCLVTVGIYIFWLGIALEKWRVKHTHLAN